MNNLKTMLGLSLLTIAFLAIGRVIGGPTGMLIALVIAGVMNFVTYFYSDKIVLKMYGAQEISPSQAPEIHDIVDELSRTAGIPKPGVYLIPSGAPNAFATGRGPGHAAVAVTEGILGILTPRELRGVLAHELAHVINRDVLISTVVATLVGALGWLAEMARWSAFLGGPRDERVDGGGGLGLVGMLLFAILMPFVALLVQMFISRQREFAADEAGAHLSGDPMSLASALRKLELGSHQVPMESNPATAHLFIVNPLTAERIASWMTTHPSTSDRVARLREIASAMGLAA